MRRHEAYRQLGLDFNPSVPIFQLRPTANRLESLQNQTGPEAIYWQTMKANHFQLEQEIEGGDLGPYRPDFGYWPMKLIVEIDGGYHKTEAQKRNDEKRALFLTNRGWEIRRHTNEEVLANPLRIWLEDLGWMTQRALCRLPRAA
jgi:very-short-patch-repair endonuclease